MRNKTRRPKVLIIAGYFDWFSGYQETAIARSMVSLADTFVLAGDRVSPIFSDEHLARIGQPRHYPAETRVEHGVSVTRLPTRELRSMVWARGVPRAVTNGSYDVVIQVMPGQLLPALASLATCTRRVVLYGDNKAMYAALSPALAAAKFAVFCATKGVLYTAVNARATQVFGYTTDTIRRLRAFHPGTPMSLFPLSYDESTFYYSPEIRAARRAELGVGNDEVVVLAAGKVNVQKRIDRVVAAVDEARKSVPQLRLVLAGLDDGPVSRALRHDIERRQMADLTTVLPFVDPRALNALFNAADLGVWPRMPAVTIQQALGTGLDVLIPDNNFTSHLFGAGIPSHELSLTSETRDHVAALNECVKRVVTQLPQTNEMRAAAERTGRDAFSALSACKSILGACALDPNGSKG